MMSRPGFLFYFNWQYIFQALNDAQCGALLMAMLHYAQTGEPPQLTDPALTIAWQALWPQLDADSSRYESVVEKRREAANKRWGKERSKNDPDGMEKYINW